ncbi:MAG: hypothetical protein U9M92_01245 [Patescibacteria group bacterium]|nr:hypothetical protein [Patescibacteria group bacterium]
MKKTIYIVIALIIVVIFAFTLRQDSDNRGDSSFGGEIGPDSSEEEILAEIERLRVEIESLEIQDPGGLSE